MNLEGLKLKLFPDLRYKITSNSTRLILISSFLIVQFSFFKSVNFKLVNCKGYADYSFIEDFCERRDGGVAS